MGALPGLQAVSEGGSTCDNNFQKVTAMRFFDATKIQYSLTVLLTLGLILTVSACSDNAVVGNFDEPLEITSVQFQSPDSAEVEPTLDEVSPGDRIVLIGENMNSVANVFFAGFEAEFNSALASQDELVVSIPGDLPFGEITADSLGEGNPIPFFRVTNEASEATFNETKITPPAPSLEGMDNEHASPGDVVTLRGQFLYLLNSITLPGGVTLGPGDVETADDGSWVEFTLPQSVSTEQNGSISITTNSGTDTAAPEFQFHGLRGEVLLDLQSGTPIGPVRHDGQIARWSWWAAAHPFSPGYFPDSSGAALGHADGAEGDIIVLQQEDRQAIDSGNNQWWPSFRSAQLGTNQWVDPDSLDLSPGNFAVKFEMSLVGEWNTGTLQILLTETNYAARYEPWQNEDGSTTPVSFDGWRTVTIPLSEFASNAGDGQAATSLQQLFGSDGVADPGTDNPPGFRLINDTDGAMPAGLSFGIDHIRVEQIGYSE